MVGNYALVLTGELLPGFAPGTAWPQLAAYFHMEADKLAQLVARAPRVIKQDGDLGKLKNLQASMARAGVQAEIYPTDERPALYVLIGDMPRGPMPRTLIEQRIQQGLWVADRLSVAEMGSKKWMPYRELAGAVLQPAAAVTVWAAPATPVALDGGRRATAAARYEQDEYDAASAWGELPEGDTIHAGFWRRCAAIILDTLILIVPWFILNRVPFMGRFLSIVGPWLYFALQESGPWQATPGKRVMGIKVVNAWGDRIGVGRATGRYFAKILSEIILCIGFIMAGLTGRKQGLHDLIANTFVVFDDVQPSHPLPTQRPPMPWYGWVLNIVGFVFVPIIIAVSVTSIAATRILAAAVGVPGHQGHTDAARAQVYEALILAETVKVMVNAQGCQANSSDLANPHIQKIEVQPGEDGACTIGVTFSENNNVDAALRGQEIDLQQDEAGGQWTCSSSLPDKYLPPQCRKGQ